MTEPSLVGFDEFCGRLDRIPSAPAKSEGELEIIKEAAEYFVALAEVSVARLSEVIQQHPSWVPALALIAGVSQERLKNELKHEFGTSGWLTLAKHRPDELVRAMDNRFQIVSILTAEQSATYTYGDVVAARAGTRVSAGRAIGRGRAVEDRIESVARALGLPFELRTQFVGRAAMTAPCDLAIPAGGREAQILCGAKGFNSTGSKLSDAVREVQQMADVRLPSQYVFAVVDGIGWLSRKADLEQIYALYSSRKIDGLYTMSMLPDFQLALEEASRRLAIPRGVISVSMNKPQA